MVQMDTRCQQTLRPSSKPRPKVLSSLRLTTQAEEDFVSVGFGLASFRMVGMGNDFKALDTQQCLLSFRRSARRLTP